MSYPCPATGCYETRCYSHCNNCSAAIVWRPPLLDKEIAYKGPKPLNKDGSIHRCMLQGTRDGKYYNTSRKYDSPERIPNWVQNHYASIKENGSCVISSCFCHELKSGGGKSV